MNIPTTAEGAESGRLTIDLDAIGENWKRLNEASGAAETGAVVKADAYGLGLDAVAPALLSAGARRFYVAQAAEGARLRAFAPEAEIVVLAPVTPAGLSICREAGLVVTLNNPDALHAWRSEAATSGAYLPAAIHIDTGMTRLGFDWRSVAEVWSALDDREQTAIVEASSHLACADEPEHPLNDAQLKRFEEATASLPKSLRRSLANSSGVFLGPAYRQSCVRPGMAIYGLNPMPGRANPMTPAVRLDVRVLQVRTLSETESVGYGATATARAGTVIATIAAGYADGLHRALSNAGAVFVDGVAAPIVGRVSMDLIAVDVSAMPKDSIKAGDFAEAIGPHQSADALAEAAGTIGYEVLTSLGRRYERRYIGGAS